MVQVERVTNQQVMGCTPYTNEPWHSLTGFDALSSKAWHCVDIMGECDASVFCRPCENDRVVFCAKANILYQDDVEIWLSTF